MRKEKAMELPFEKKKGEDLWAFGGDSDKAPPSTMSPFLTFRERDFLLSPDGTQVKANDLEGKVVGLYFSANWYPPCRNFTAVLAGIYNQLKEEEAQFEVIFVSSDEDTDAFNNYRATMPWLSIPFSDVDAKKALTQQFNIEGIPSLVVLQPYDKDGTARVDGVELVYKYGVRAYPFTEEKLEELQREEREKHEKQTIISLLANQDRDFLLAQTSLKKVNVASLAGKTVGLYFSGHWCLPCHKFTPKLTSIYHKIKQMLAEERDQDFEIVFISSDRNEAAFNSYYTTMPWLAVPFGDPTIKALTKYFDIQAIPCLVIIGPDGKTVTRKGRKFINLYLEKAYPFTPAQLKLLQKQMDEEAKNFPRLEYHEGHQHELTLVSDGSGGGPFICCECDEQGYGWAYQCLGCGYELHPKCIKAVNRGVSNV